MLKTVFAAIACSLLLPSLAVGKPAPGNVRTETALKETDMLTWMDCTLPNDEFVMVHFEQRDTAGAGPWTSGNGAYQPFKSRVDRLHKRVYWRKDDPGENYYGELFTYDDNVVRLHTETYPPYTIPRSDPDGKPGMWDKRIDRFRLFVEAGKPWSEGRVIAPRTVSTSWTYRGEVNTYMVHCWEELNKQTAPLFQLGVKDYVTITRIAPFNCVFDGECPGWPASEEFKSFDEAIVINQHMNGTGGRERFFFARRGSRYYGIVRWDNSGMVGGKWVVWQRTVGLGTYTPENTSLKGFQTRNRMDLLISPR